MTIFFLIVITFSAQAQIVLKPSIGVTSQPKDSDVICYIPVYIDPDMMFESPGLHTGDTVPDFKFFTYDGDSVQLSNLLSDGKPVLLVGGNYTCPVFRDHLNDLADIVTIYGERIHTYVIYTVEAHPASPQKSPYSGTVWNPQSNVKQGINYYEPVYYKDRKDVDSIMLRNLNVPVPVLLDGPCNQWWESFAYAPNPAFLIQPNGIIYEKQGWFNGDGKTPMSEVIDQLLNSMGIQNEQPELKVAVSFTGSDIVFNTENLLTGSYYAVTNSVGQLIASGSITDDTWTVSATKLSSGIYLYQILNDSQKATGKVFVH